MKKIFFVVATALQAVSPQEAYNAALVAFHEKQWEKVRLEAREVFEKAPESPFLSDLYFYVGSAYFHQKDYEQANFYFSEFLKKYASPKYFEEAIVYKFQIAEAYQKGAKKHVMGMASMPQWIPARDDAYALYDEVTALGTHTLSLGGLSLSIYSMYDALCTSAGYVFFSCSIRSRAFSA